MVRNNLIGLRATIDSLRTQDSDCFEHVIIDGASTDGTPDFLKKLSTPYSLTAISEPDNGLYDAMNKAINHAKGELVLFLNGADSLISPSTLRTVANDFQAGSWIWGYGGIRYVDIDGRTIAEHPGKPYSARKVALGLTYFPHPATFVQRATLAAVNGFDSTFGWSADQELLLRFADLSKPRVFDATLTNMQIGGAHGTSTFFDRAQRYRRIRERRGEPFLNSYLFDRLFTGAQGSAWTLQHFIREKLRGRPRI